MSGPICKYNGAVIPCPKAMVPAPPQAPPNWDAIWNDFFLHALAFKGTDDFPYLSVFMMTLDRSGCGCPRKWSNYLHDHPPDFSNYLSWAIGARNDLGTSWKIPPLAPDHQPTPK